MWLSFFVVPAFIILCVLGSWQMQRLSWKSNLIEEYNTKFNKAPLNLNENFKNLSGNRFRRVIVNGIFDHNKEINIIGKTYEGNAGFHIVTPFITENSNTIYINRGWVPKKYVSQTSRKFSLVEGKTQIIGLIRMPQTKGYFVPNNEPKNGFWFTVIPSEFNEQFNLNAEKKFYIVELKVGDELKLPIPANGEIQIPNNHLQYAITWYSLAIGLIIIYFAWHRQNGYLSLVE